MFLWLWAAVIKYSRTNNYTYHKQILDHKKSLNNNIIYFRRAPTVVTKYTAIKCKIALCFRDSRIPSLRTGIDCGKTNSVLSSL